MALNHSTVNPFKGAASRILRTLVADPTKKWSGRELAERLGLSQAWVNRVLTTLENYRIVQRGGNSPKSKTQLIDAQELLRRWTAIYSFQQNHTYLYLLQHKDPVRYLAKIAKEREYQYALTGYAAANLIKKVMYDAPPMAYLWSTKDSVDFQSERATLENEHDFIPVLKKANLIIVEPVLGNDVFFGSTDLKGSRVVSPLQLFLDLYTMDRDHYIIEQLAAFWRQYHIPYEL